MEVITISTSDFIRLLDERLEIKLTEKLKDLTSGNTVSPVDTTGDSYITTTQLAEKLQVSELTIRNHRKAGLIPSYRFGGRKIYFKMSELDIIGTNVNKPSRKR